MVRAGLQVAFVKVERRNEPSDSLPWSFEVCCRRLILGQGVCLILNLSSFLPNVDIEPLLTCGMMYDIEPILVPTLVDVMCSV